ncbi:hypothetical protein QF001_000925 [Paraburkholderia youngii]|uniref:STY1053 family phage-associated protein n=1 Tax=Paraburkholderia youngii TaxID=2782701 RepID=UPI003D1E3D62
MAIVKSDFTLILDDGRRFEFSAGAQDIPAELADHWYVKAHCEPEPVAYDAPVEAVVEPAIVETPIESAEVAEPEKRRPGRPKKP